MKIILLWWEFSNMMKFITLMKIHHWYEYSSMCWKSVNVLKIQLSAEKISDWWKFTTLMIWYDDIYHFNDMKCPHWPDKNYQVWPSSRICWLVKYQLGWAGAQPSLSGIWEGAWQETWQTLKKGIAKISLYGFEF